jgi:acetyl esterase/lipase
MAMKFSCVVALALALILGCAGPLAAAEPIPHRILRDIEFAEVDGHKLHLDLYLPEQVAHPALIVWVHGGGWRNGSKDNMPLSGIVNKGFAAASVDYRLSPVARFPAQIHDIKAAIRFLRAKQSEYGYDPDRFVIAGSSAGAHLASLVGVTNGHPELEGRVGGHLNESSDVQAIVSYFGASNLTTILSQSTPHGLRMRVPALEQFLGARPEKNPQVAKLASPVFHVDPGDPPLMLLHGDQDPQMPVNQSIELQGRYRQLGLPVELEFVHGAGHGGKQFTAAERNELVIAFLENHLPPN